MGSPAPRRTWNIIGRNPNGPSPGDSFTCLRAYRERQEADQAVVGRELSDEALLFSHLDGSPYLPDTISHAFTKIAHRAGLKGVRLHDLRHAHASLMPCRGVHPKIVQERLGHSTMAVALDTYSHVTPGLQAAAVLKFDEEMAGAVPGGVSVEKTQTAPLTNR